MKKYAEPKTLDARGRTLFHLGLLEKECTAVKSAMFAKDFPLFETHGFAAISYKNIAI